MSVWPRNKTRTPEGDYMKTNFCLIHMKNLFGLFGLSKYGVRCLTGGVMV